MGDSVEEAKENYKKVEHYRNLMLLKTSGIRKGRSFSKNAAITLFKIVPMNEKKLLGKVATLGNVKDFDNCQIGGNTLGAWRWKEIMPIEYMGTPQLYDFEDICIYGAEQPEKYLSHLYGDWRQLPPVEKQVTHHDFIFCDLEKSWLEM